MTTIDRRRFLLYAGGTAAAVPFLSMLSACGDDDEGASGSGDLGEVSYQLSWLKDAQWVGEYQQIPTATGPMPVWASHSSQAGERWTLPPWSLPARH